MRTSQRRPLNSNRWCIVPGCSCTGTKNPQPPSREITTRPPSSEQAVSFGNPLPTLLRWVLNIGYPPARDAAAAVLTEDAPRHAPMSNGFAHNDETNSSSSSASSLLVSPPLSPPSQSYSSQPSRPSPVHQKRQFVPSVDPPGTSFPPAKRRAFGPIVAQPVASAGGADPAAAPRCDPASLDSASQSLSNHADNTPPPIVRKFDAKIKKLGKSFVCFEACGNDPESSVPPCPEARQGDLFLFKHQGSTSPQMWVRQAAGRWSPIEVEGPHPLFTDYRLYIKSNGIPSWVTKKTIATYKSRSKKSAGCASGASGSYGAGSCE